MIEKKDYLKGFADGATAVIDGMMQRFPENDDMKIALIAAQVALQETVVETQEAMSE